MEGHFTKLARSH